MKTMDKIQKYLADRQYHCTINRNIESGSCRDTDCKHNNSLAYKTDQCSANIKVHKMLAVLREKI